MTAREREYWARLYSVILRRPPGPPVEAKPAGCLPLAAKAAICASRGPVLWAQRQCERAQLIAMIKHESQ